MPKNCFECRFAVDGWCYAHGKPNVDALANDGITNWCPLKEYETTDKMTLAAAMDDKTFAVFSMIAATDPLRPINVKMNYWKLFEIVKMLKEEKRGN